MVTSTYSLPSKSMILEPRPSFMKATELGARKGPVACGESSTFLARSRISLDFGSFSALSFSMSLAMVETSV